VAVQGCPCKAAVFALKACKWQEGFAAVDAKAFIEQLIGRSFVHAQVGLKPHP
jgi:hypothetical protein